MDIRTAWNQDLTEPASVAILAGGQSTRIGQDKALLRFDAAGATLLELVLSVVHELSDDCYVVASDRPAYEPFGVRVLPDLYSEGAVLGGIGSALRHAVHRKVLVVSCDHPFLVRPLLQAMLEDRDEWQVLVPVEAGESRQHGGRIRHALHAVYDKSCLFAIERSLAAGQLQVVSFYPEVVVKELDEAWVNRFDPDRLSLFSVNTPAALERAREIYRTVNR